MDCLRSIGMCGLESALGVRLLSLLSLRVRLPVALVD